MRNKKINSKLALSLLLFSLLLSVSVIADFYTNPNAAGFLNLPKEEMTVYNFERLSLSQKIQVMESGQLDDDVFARIVTYTNFFRDRPDDFAPNAAQRFFEIFESAEASQKDLWYMYLPEKFKNAETFLQLSDGETAFSFGFDDLSRADQIKVLEAVNSGTGTDLTISDDRLSSKIILNPIFVFEGRRYHSSSAPHTARRILEYFNENPESTLFASMPHDYLTAENFAKIDYSLQRNKLNFAAAFTRMNLEERLKYLGSNFENLDDEILIQLVNYIRSANAEEASALTQKLQEIFDSNPTCELFSKLPSNLKTFENMQKLGEGATCFEGLSKSEKFRFVLENFENIYESNEFGSYEYSPSPSSIFNIPYLRISSSGPSLSFQEREDDYAISPETQIEIGGDRFEPSGDLYIKKDLSEVSCVGQMVSDNIFVSGNFKVEYDSEGNIEQIILLEDSSTIEWVEDGNVKREVRGKSRVLISDGNISEIILETASSSYNNYEFDLEIRSIHQSDFAEDYFIRENYLPDFKRKHIYLNPSEIDMDGLTSNTRESSVVVNEGEEYSGMSYGEDVFISIDGNQAFAFEYGTKINFNGEDDGTQRNVNFGMDNQEYRPTISSGRGMFGYYKPSFYRTDSESFHEEEYDIDNSISEDHFGIGVYSDINKGEIFYDIDETNRLNWMKKDGTFLMDAGRSANFLFSDDYMFSVSPQTGISVLNLDEEGISVGEIVTSDGINIFESEEDKIRIAGFHIASGDITDSPQVRALLRDLKELMRKHKGTLLGQQFAHSALIIEFKLNQDQYDEEYFTNKEEEFFDSYKPFFNSNRTLFQSALASLAGSVLSETGDQVKFLNILDYASQLDPSTKPALEMQKAIRKIKSLRFLAVSRTIAKQLYLKDVQSNRARSVLSGLEFYEQLQGQSWISQGFAGLSSISPVNMFRDYMNKEDSEIRRDYATRIYLYEIINKLILDGYANDIESARDIIFWCLQADDCDSFSKENGEYFDLNEEYGFEEFNTELFEQLFYVDEFLKVTEKQSSTRFFNFEDELLTYYSLALYYRDEGKSNVAAGLLNIIIKTTEDGTFYEDTYNGSKELFDDISGEGILDLSDATLSSEFLLDIVADVTNPFAWVTFGALGRGAGNLLARTRTGSALLSKVRAFKGALTIESGGLVEASTWSQLGRTFLAKASNIFVEEIIIEEGIPAIAGTAVGYARNDTRLGIQVTEYFSFFLMGLTGSDAGMAAKLEFEQKAFAKLDLREQIKFQAESELMGDYIMASSDFDLGKIDSLSDIVPSLENSPLRQKMIQNYISQTVTFDAIESSNLGKLQKSSEVIQSGKKRSSVFVYSGSDVKLDHIEKLGEITLVDIEGSSEKAIFIKNRFNGETAYFVSSNVDLEGLALSSDGGRLFRTQTADVDLKAEPEPDIIPSDSEITRSKAEEIADLEQRVDSEFDEELMDISAEDLRLDSDIADLDFDEDLDFSESNRLFSDTDSNIESFLVESGDANYIVERYGSPDSARQAFQSYQAVRDSYSNGILELPKMELEGDKISIEMPPDFMHTLDFDPSGYTIGFTNKVEYSGPEAILRFMEAVYPKDVFEANRNVLTRFAESASAFKERVPLDVEQRFIGDVPLADKSKAPKIDMRSWLSWYDPNIPNHKSIMENLKYVDSDTFVNDLSILMRNFQSEVGGKPYALLYGTKPHSSNYYMGKLAEEMGLFDSNRPVSEYYTFGENDVAGTTTSRLIDQGVRDFLLLDDASYSGEQIARYVSDFSQDYLAEHVSELGPGEKFTVYVSVPYLTEASFHYIRSKMLNIGSFVEIKFVSNVEGGSINNVKFIPETDNVVDPDAELGRLSQGDFWDSKGLIYFTHRVADLASFPRSLGELNFREFTQTGYEGAKPYGDTESFHYLREDIDLMTKNQLKGFDFDINERGIIDRLNRALLDSGSSEKLEFARIIKSEILDFKSSGGRIDSDFLESLFQKTGSNFESRYNDLLVSRDFLDLDNDGEVDVLIDNELFLDIDPADLDFDGDAGDVSALDLEADEELSDISAADLEDFLDLDGDGRADIDSELALDMDPYLIDALESADVIADAEQSSIPLEQRIEQELYSRLFIDDIHMDFLEDNNFWAEMNRWKSDGKPRDLSNYHTLSQARASFIDLDYVSNHPEIESNHHLLYGEGEWDSWVRTNRIVRARARLALEGKADPDLTLDMIYGLITGMTNGKYQARSISGIQVAAGASYVSTDLPNGGRRITARYTKNFIDDLYNNELVSKHNDLSSYTLVKDRNGNFFYEKSEVISDFANRVKTDPKLEKRVMSGLAIKYPGPEFVEPYLNNLLSWYNAEIKKPGADIVSIAAKFQREFVSIHPYPDFNGRTSRMLMNYILESNGYGSAIPRINNDLVMSKGEWEKEIQEGVIRYRKHEAEFLSKLGPDAVDSVYEASLVNKKVSPEIESSPDIVWNHFTEIDSSIDYDSAIQEMQFSGSIDSFVEFEVDSMIESYSSELLGRRKRSELKRYFDSVNEFDIDKRTGKIIVDESVLSGFSEEVMDFPERQLLSNILTEVGVADRRKLITVLERIKSSDLYSLNAILRMYRGAGNDPQLYSIVRNKVLKMFSPDYDAEFSEYYRKNDDGLADAYILENDPHIPNIGRLRLRSGGPSQSFVAMGMSQIYAGPISFRNFEGFRARGMDADLESYLLENEDYSSYAYLSSSKTERIALEFARKKTDLTDGYVFILDNSDHAGIDVASEQAHSRGSQFTEELEVSWKYKITRDRVVGALVVKDGRVTGEMIKNPYYRPKQEYKHLSEPLPRSIPLPESEVELSDIVFASDFDASSQNIESVVNRYAARNRKNPKAVASDLIRSQIESASEINDISSNPSMVSLLDFLDINPENVQDINTLRRNLEALSSSGAEPPVTSGTGSGSSGQTSGGTGPVDFDPMDVGSGSASAVSDI